MIKSLYRKSETEYNILMNPSNNQITVINILDNQLTKRQFNYIEGVNKEDLGEQISSLPNHIAKILQENNITVPPNIEKDFRFITKGITPPIRPELKPAIIGALIALGHDSLTVREFIYDKIS